MTGMATKRMGGLPSTAIHRPRPSIKQLISRLNLSPAPQRPQHANRGRRIRKDSSPPRSTTRESIRLMAPRHARVTFIQVPDIRKTQVTSEPCKRARTSPPGCERRRQMPYKCRGPPARDLNQPTHASTFAQNGLTDDLLCVNPGVRRARPHPPMAKTHAAEGSCVFLLRQRPRCA